MTPPINIRCATAQDAEAISLLIRGSAHHFLLEPSGRGAENFFDGITAQAIRTCITSANFHYLVAQSETELAGAVALRDGKHLFHLFVAPAFQRQGLARALWSAVKQAADPALEAFTVNSSPNAVAVYERFGFSVVGPRREANGIVFVPMKSVANGSPA